MGVARIQFDRMVSGNPLMFLCFFKRANKSAYFTAFVNFLLLFVRFIAFFCVEYYHLNAF